MNNFTAHQLWFRCRAVEPLEWHTHKGASIRGAFYQQALVSDKGLTSGQVGYARLDTYVGAVMTDTVSFFIIVSCAVLLHPRGIYERADPTARRREGLPTSEGCIYGEEPPEIIEIREHGHRFLVDVRKGQKTGFYLDQSQNRRESHRTNPVSSLRECDRP